MGCEGAKVPGLEVVEPPSVTGAAEPSPSVGTHFPWWPRGGEGGETLGCVRGVGKTGEGKGPAAAPPSFRPLPPLPGVPCRSSEISAAGAGPVGSLFGEELRAAPFAPQLPRASPCWRVAVNPAAAGGEIPGSLCVLSLSAFEPVSGTGQRKRGRYSFLAQSGELEVGGPPLGPGENSVEYPLVQGYGPAVLSGASQQQDHQDVARMAFTVGPEATVGENKTKQNKCTAILARQVIMPLPSKTRSNNLVFSSPNLMTMCM